MNGLLALFGDAIFNLALVAAIFVPLELASPARPGSTRSPFEAGQDLAFYAGQTLIFLPVVAILLGLLAAPLADSPAPRGRGPGLSASVGEERPHSRACARVPSAGSGATAPFPPGTQTREPALKARTSCRLQFWLPIPTFHALPALVQIAIAVILADFCAYWGHRAQHRIPLLWRFHAVHHTSTEVNWLAAYREHPLDGLYTQALVNLPAILLGVDFGAWLGVVVFRGAWAIFVHSNVHVPLGPLKWLFGAPEFHRAHHAVDARGHYANLAPWLDVLFGTHGPAGEPTRFGVEGVPPRTWWGLVSRGCR